MATRIANVKITSSGTGAKVIVGTKDLSALVSQYEVRHKAGEIPTIILTSKDGKVHELTLAVADLVIKP